MKARVSDLRALADAVAWAAKNIATRPQVPVLAGIRLTAAADGGLEVVSYDYEVGTAATVGADVDEPGVVLVSGRLLAEIVKALPSSKPLTLSMVGAHVELVCGSARFTLPTMPVEDYPAPPGLPAEVGTVDGVVWAQAVAQVTVAAGRDESLPMMTGVKVVSDGERLMLMATDRYRLAVRELPWTPVDENAALDLLVPAKTLADTAKALAGIDRIGLYRDTAKVGEGIFGLAVRGRALTSRLLDGVNYPPVLTLFPTEVNATAVVQVAALVEVVKRVALVAERATPVLLSFSTDVLVVEAGTQEEARASEALPADYTGDPLTVGFNPQFLIDGLQNLGASKAEFRFVQPFKPAVLVGVGPDGAVDESYRYLIMPIRVTK